jgi:hypothetical protein
MKEKPMTRSSFTASFALIGLALLAAAGSAKAQNDIAVGSLAQCWKATVRINTMMETGTLTPPLTGDQVQALYRAVAAMAIRIKD